MDGRKRECENFALADVLDWPGKRCEAQTCMQYDAKQHRKRAQGIKIVSSWDDCWWIFAHVAGEDLRMSVPLDGEIIEHNYAEKLLFLLFLHNFLENYSPEAVGSWGIPEKSNNLRESSKVDAIG